MLNAQQQLKPQHCPGSSRAHTSVIGAWHHGSIGWARSPSVLMLAALTSKLYAKSSMSPTLNQWFWGKSLTWRWRLRRQRHDNDDETDVDVTKRRSVMCSDSDVSVMLWPRRIEQSPKAPSLKLVHLYDCHHGWRVNMVFRFVWQSQSRASWQWEKDGFESSEIISIPSSSILKHRNLLLQIAIYVLKNASSH